MPKDFSRVLIAASLLAALCATAGAQPGGGLKKDTAPGKKDDATSQLKTFTVKNANLAEVQQYLTKHFTPAPSKPGAAAVAGKPTILVAVEPKTKTIFVRGPAPDVDEAGKVIAQLDGMDTKGPLNVIALQNVSVDEAMKVLTALDLARSVSPCPQSRLLILPQGDPTADEVKTVLVRLESAFKPETKVKVEPKPGTAPR
jgi:hypothetical protein